MNCHLDLIADAIRQKDGAQRGVIVCAWRYLPEASRTKWRELALVAITTDVVKRDAA